jgi:hypothetical protein
MQMRKSNYILERAIKEKRNKKATWDDDVPVDVR